MAKRDLDLNPVEFITIGTVGPKGKRVFHLQAGFEKRLVSFIMEKEQAYALGDAIREFLQDLDERDNTETQVEMAGMDMELREPIQPLFRIAQMGLAYDAAEDRVILIAQEGVSEESDEEPAIVRMWCTRRQLKALGLQALDMVEQGRPSPKQNGRITYYWT